MVINKNIFREYDVRGIYPTDLNEEVAYVFGKAFGIPSGHISWKLLEANSPPECKYLPECRLTTANFTA